MRVSSCRTRHQLKKAFHNFVLTAVCGFTTVLVLKGSTGFGDYTENPPPLELQHARLLTEVQHLAFISSLSSVSPNSANPSQNHGNTRPAHNLNPNLKPNHNSTSFKDPHHLLQNPTNHSTAIANHDNVTAIVDRATTDHNHSSNTTSTINHSTSQKLSILLVTGSPPSPCASPLGDHYLLKFLKNKMDYCRLHGMEMFSSVAEFDPQMSGFWAKLPLLQRLMLAHPEKEWLWWVDSDAVITDMAFELPMDRYKDHNLVLHGWEELVYGQKNWVGLNTGSVLIRNCQWSLDLLKAWAPMGLKGQVREKAGLLLSKALVGRPHFEADDQSALIYLLNEEKSKWANKVYLENAYFLHGYWLILVDKYEEIMKKYHPGFGDDRWPFVTHFVGCKPCSNNNDHTFVHANCLKHMERAFNFADNQVLLHYGLQHEALGTNRLRTINSMTSTRVT